MMPHFLRVITSLCLVGGLAASARGESPVAATAASTTARPESVPASGATAGREMFIVQADDASATMAKDTGRLARAESEHYRRELRAGDRFIRLEFSDDSRLTQFMAIRTAEDAAHVGRVLMDLDTARGRFTCISAGLRHAKKLVLEQGGNRAVVLILTTDALTDPPPAITVGEEERRLEAVCRWWRERPDTQIILVGVARGSRSERSLRRLAVLLGARRVTVEILEEGTPIRRAFKIARVVQPATVAPQVHQAERRTGWEQWSLPAAAGLLTLLLGLYALRRRRSSPASGENVVDDLDLALPQVELPSEESPDSGWRGKVTVSVTSYGETIVHPVRVPEDAPERRILLGEAGQVVLPELPGAPLGLIPDASCFRLQVEPGLEDMELDGDRVPAEGGILPVASGAHLAWGSHVASIRYTSAAPSPLRALPARGTLR